MMRHKSIRVMYMFTVYALGAPLFLLGALMLMGWACKLVICDDYKMSELKELWYAALAGLRAGHATNMLWVINGNQVFESKETGL